MTRPPALVTGASRGIGLGIARRLARAGHPVVLTARDPDRLERVRAELAAGGARVFAAAADLREPRAPAELVARAEALAGGLGVLVNNAGTAPTARFAATSDAMLEEALDLHVKAPFRLARAALEGMLARGGGCIVQMASVAGLRGHPFVSAYVVAKHGMVGLTRALAAEFASTPVRVHAVCPGFVDTDITRQGAREVAARGRHTEEEVLAMYAAMNACGRLLGVEEVADVVAEICDGDPPPPSGSIHVMDEMPPTVQS